MKHCQTSIILLAATLFFSKTAEAQTRSLSVDAFRDRLKGGWAGQMIGVSFGSVYEFQSNGKPILGPLRAWKPDFVENSLQQDDIYVEMTFLKSLVRHGLGVTARQAGEDFRDSKYRLWHANMAARENLRQDIFPPNSGHPRYNPHADDIDFQIEADLFGLIAPGMFRAGLRLADIFGSVMNYGDGLYGGRFVVAMYCQAYLEPRPTKEAVRRCIEAGLAAIPSGSAYAKLVRDVIAGYERQPGDWQATWQAIETKWGSGDLCPDGLGNSFNIDAKLNGGYIALGLLYGEADFSRTLEITTRCGQDADCNPSNAAGVLGALYGYKAIPMEYTSGIPLLTGRKFEYTDYDFPQLLAACEAVALRLLKQEGGSVIRSSGKEWWVLPEDHPMPPAKLEQMETFGKVKLAEWRADFGRRLAEARRRGIQPEVERWSAGWKLVATGMEMDPGVRALHGEERVLVLHPVDRATPAVIERTQTIPAIGAKLYLRAASFVERSEADYVLRVKVSGKTILDEVIRSAGAWKPIEVDLAPWAGKRITIQIENAAGGASDWAWEAMYLAEATIR